MLAYFASDLRQAWRHWRRNWAAGIFNAVSLSLGIGACCAVFSVIYAVLLNPFPYRDSNRLVYLEVQGKTDQRQILQLSGKEFMQFQRAAVLDGAFAMDPWDMTLSGGELPETAHVGELSGNAFDYFGVAPLVGRTFTVADAPLEGNPERVAVLSYGFWQSHYGGSPNALGQKLILDRDTYTVIGVLPPRFTWWEAQIYVPLDMTNPGHIFVVGGRLKAGVTPAAAAGELQGLIEEFGVEVPERFPRGSRIVVTNLITRTVGPLASSLVMMSIAVVSLLLIGIGNVSILLLARGTARGFELAVRTAIGATRRRLIAQLITESVFIALVGAAIGVVVASFGIAAILSWLPANSIPPEVAVRLNVPVLAVTIVLALASGALAGLYPALRFSRAGGIELMRGATRGATSGTAAGAHGALIAAQIAFTMVLLAAGGAAFKELLNLRQTRLGYDPYHVVMLEVPIPEGSYSTWPERVAFFDRLRQQVAHTPGVERVAVAFYGLPPVSRWTRKIEIFGKPTSHDQEVYVQLSSPEFFDVLKIPLRFGRIWTSAETARSARVAVINQTMATKFWPNADAIGSKVRLSNLVPWNSWILAAPDSNGWLEVVGIVGDTPNDGLRRPIVPAIYAPYPLLLSDTPQLVIRAQGDESAIIRPARQQIQQIAPSLAVSRIRTADSRLSSLGWARERFIAVLFIGIDLLAIGLAACGVYSVIAYAMSHRRYEFGIRMALGATRRDLLQLITESMIRTVAVGVILGAALTVAARWAIAEWLIGNVTEPTLLALVALLLVAVAVTATVTAAARGAGIDPARALRND